MLNSLLRLAISPTTRSKPNRRFSTVEISFSAALTANSLGSSVITVTQNAGTNYNQASVQKEIEVTGSSYTCNSGQYLNISSCATCTSGNYCSGGTWTYDGTVKGLTSCGSLGTGYTSSSGATANTNCYLPVDAGKYRTGTSGTTTSGCGSGKRRPDRSP